MKRIVTAQYISNGGEIPRGYAIAYWLPWSDRAVCYPVGLHLFVSATRAIYTRISHARFPEGWETLWRVRFERGRELGYEEGYRAAMRHVEIVREIIGRSRL